MAGPSKPKHGMPAELWAAVVEHGGAALKWQPEKDTLWSSRFWNTEILLDSAEMKAHHERGGYLVESFPLGDRFTISTRFADLMGYALAEQVRKPSPRPQRRRRSVSAEIMDIQSGLTTCKVSFAKARLQKVSARAKTLEHELKLAKKEIRRLKDA